jgi:hypothetical protein
MVAAEFQLNISLPFKPGRLLFFNLATGVIRHQELWADLLLVVLYLGK